METHATVPSDGSTHMARSKTSNPNPDGPSFAPPRHRPRWLVASLCFFLATLLTVALIDYHPDQIGYLDKLNNTTDESARNLVGKLGADVVRLSNITLGAAAWFIPLFLFWAAIVAVRNARRLATTRFIAMLVCLVTSAGLFSMAGGGPSESQYFTSGLGGKVGHFTYNVVLDDMLGVFGAGLFLALVNVLGVIFIFTRDIGAEFDRLIQGFQAWQADRRAMAAARAEEKRLLREARAREKEEAKAAKLAAKQAAKAAPAAGNTTLPPAPPKSAKFVPAPDVDPLAASPVARETPPPPPPSVESAPKPKVIGLKLGRNPTPAASETPPATDKAVGSDLGDSKITLNIVKAEELKKARASVPQSTDDGYRFPSLNLLAPPATPHADNTEEEHQRNAANLLRILEEFGVKVTLGEVHVGPVITRYEVVPAAGVRVEKIANLDKNIALGMRAQSVRILAPIPGKAAVGVEVPNQHPTPVGMREILESEDWSHARAELPIALGKDVSGKPLISDLTKMPHLLIAGATGSGKSVCINSIVSSILFSKSPSQVRLLMVDPKVVELKVFNTLPHMLIPVVTEPKKVPGALKWLLGEMEQRYQMFAKANVRNIAGFNQRHKRGAKPELPEPAETQPALEGLDPRADDGIELPDHLPYIVAIIDELADLMMVAPAEIETSIARLAQLARAAGIHLIIATQRPSVNVITGVIKANLPSRIAFQVASQVDSRTILDGKGADTLIGRGDMLFSPPGTARLVRAQGAFVSDDEVMGLVEFLKVNGPPIYAAEVQAQIDRAAAGDEEDGEGGSDGDLGDDEELFQQALGVLKATKRASTSMIQRRLRIGYNRAARLMDLMEDKGIVGPENGSSPRDILVDLDSL
jgi:DNA segregation ATPase FtsK/SpoIIIE, S-DNA-T family